MQIINVCRNLTVIFLCLLSGCTAPTFIQLLNMNEDAIVISYKNDSLDIVSDQVEANGWIKIKGLFDTKFSISNDTGTLNFNVRMVDEDFVLHDGFGPFFERKMRAVFYNGCIYLISKDDELIDINVISEYQPIGYPLCQEPVSK
jgi:hypothetical protein